MKKIQCQRYFKIACNFSLRISSLPLSQRTPYIKHLLLPKLGYPPGKQRTCIWKSVNCWISSKIILFSSNNWMMKIKLWHRKSTQHNRLCPCAWEFALLWIFLLVHLTVSRTPCVFQFLHQYETLILNLRIIATWHAETPDRIFLSLNKSSGTSAFYILFQKERISLNCYLPKVNSKGHPIKSQHIGVQTLENRH